MGAETREELGGSIWQQVVHDELAGLPPQVDLSVEQRLGAFITDQRDKIVAAHDLSEGGLSQAVVELAIQSGRGMAVNPMLSQHESAVAQGRTLAQQAAVGLFSETASRVLLAVRSEDYGDLMRDLAETGLTGGWIGLTGVSDAAGQPIIRFGSGVYPVLPFGGEIELDPAKQHDDDFDIVISLEEAETAWKSTLPALFSHAAGNNSVI